MNKFKISPNSAFIPLYDVRSLIYSSDDNLLFNNRPYPTDIGHYLFWYGSNSLSQLKKRVENNNLTNKKAYLPGYIRIFAGYSKKWNGGTASILESSIDHYVKGSLVYLKESELKKLDKFEGANKNSNPFSKKDNIYRRCYVDVKDEKNNNIHCLVYIRNNHNWIEYPSNSYLEALKKNMKTYWNELDTSNQINIYDKDLELKGTF